MLLSMWPSVARFSSCSNLPPNHITFLGNLDSIWTKTDLNVMWHFDLFQSFHLDNNNRVNCNDHVGNNNNHRGTNSITTYIIRSKWLLLQRPQLLSSCSGDVLLAYERSQSHVQMTVIVRILLSWLRWEKRELDIVT